MPANDLTASRKERAAVLLARGLNAEHVAREVQVTGRTVRRWLENPEYAERVRELRRTSLGETLRVLETISRNAVGVLGGIMTNSAESSTVRVRAAIGVLTLLPRLAEHVELEERVALLEAATSCRDEGGTS
ncbi:helix-turn-helix domain-containing protein [Streptomyces sp. NBC_01439]|uniref:helix-turn-helix domain-containing protein n=1 Tax=Streptomyces sp. NBC_01439 TaxID=2903867 RepID=UPI002E2DF66B|nr:helix-turn-helix domain-containing protein [Streptomyces sp. NBC_01439]